MFGFDEKKTARAHPDVMVARRFCELRGNRFPERYASSQAP